MRFPVLGFPFLIFDVGITGIWVAQVKLEADEKAWCTLTAEANNKVLGKRLGKKLGGVKKELAKLGTDALWPLLEV